MDYISRHLSLLRQEITDLRNLNAVYSEHVEHSPIEKTAFDLRQTRLSQIKQELQSMRNRPPDVAVWWDKRARA
jgi:molybdenum cofactor biosynthesis enzyme MoaA